MLNRIIDRLERWLFAHRLLVLGALLLLTLVMGLFARQLQMDAGFDKQIPTDHPYVAVFQQYRAELFGANRLTVVVRARQGTIWSPQGLRKLYDATQAVTLLPHIDRLGVQSLWTPNSFVTQITEEGFRSDQVIPATVTPEALSAEDVAQIRRTAKEGGLIGSLVSRDEAGAMITADLDEVGSDGERLDYVAYNHLLESRLRQPLEDAGYEIQIIGFAKQIGDIADGAKSVGVFCAIALLLTAAAVFWYCRSLRFTLLPIFCSLASLVWQFGCLRLLGYGLDPLGVLVPFLVFAIGVSHGVQQINYIVREIAHGKSSFDAARSSFSGLLIPGSLALATALVSFVTLLLISIPMIRELAITASLGVAFKIVTNLVMLPLAASYIRFDGDYARRAMQQHERRARWLRLLARVAEPRRAAAVMLAVACVSAVAVWQSRHRVIGTLQAGAPELRPEARFNRDAVSIVGSFDLGLDWLSVVIEAPPASCSNPAVGLFGDQLGEALRTVPGVVSVASYAQSLRSYNEGYNEGNPKMNVVPIDATNYAGLSAEIGRLRGYLNKDCSMTAVHLYLSDHKATTINGVIEAVKAFEAGHGAPGLRIRLAAGNAGVLAATNEAVEHSELPMMLYVYAAIVVLVFAVYRDWRAVVACCLPLTVGTFIGYWFMKAFEIGLTVATLPVMVLAVGIGVDYAFYIYNRLQAHLAAGAPIARAIELALQEVGMATIFTALTLAIGVATWSFSELKFQADMGKLLAFMFIVNLVMAMTALPALAVLLERWLPRRAPVRAPGVFSH